MPKNLQKRIFKKVKFWANDSKWRTTFLPFSGVHAKTFIADRFALIGDAAVGMHQ